jgi:hypothetical protein
MSATPPVGDRLDTNHSDMPGMLRAPVMRGRAIASDVPSAPQHAACVVHESAHHMGRQGLFGVSARLTFLAAQQKAGPVFASSRLMIW